MTKSDMRKDRDQVDFGDIPLFSVRKKRNVPLLPRAAVGKGDECAAVALTEYAHQNGEAGRCQHISGHLEEHWERDSVDSNASLTRRVCAVAPINLSDHGID